ncbi:MAG: hypothetical protein HY902_14170 [Deltaproteobacteria bacterium]|nr:hypothetical protein [Deltaproteobacteria bacterium]
MHEPQTMMVQSEYQDVVQTLQALTAQHERTYRLKVGELILDRFFAGDPGRFGSRDRTKDQKFADFLATHAAEVAALDLSEHTLRRCVRVKICYDSLPAGLRDQLAWSATLAISAIPEVNLRARIATAAVAEQWPLGKVRDVVAQALDNRVWDADPSTPGLQLPEPKPEPPLQPGRLVTRTEKWVEEIRAWHQEFAQVDAAKLSQPQVARMRAAVVAVRAELQRLEKALE